MGSFSYISEPLGLGAAGGNQFEVTLRALAGASPAAAAASVETLSRDGFVNYFGLQRFGSDNSATHMCPPAKPPCECAPSLEGTSAPSTCPTLVLQISTACFCPWVVAASNTPLQCSIVVRLAALSMLQSPHSRHDYTT